MLWHKNWESRSTGREQVFNSHTIFLMKAEKWKLIVNLKTSNKNQSLLSALSPLPTIKGGHCRSGVASAGTAQGGSRCPFPMSQLGALQGPPPSHRHLFIPQHTWPGKPFPNKTPSLGKLAHTIQKRWIKGKKKPNQHNSVAFCPNMHI